MIDRFWQQAYRFRWFIGPAALVFLAVTVRVLWSGYQDLAVADQARKAGLKTTAVEFYGRAARWHFPLIGAQNPAGDRLMDLCWELERSGDNKTALSCFREARGAVLSTRWLLGTQSGILENANQAIARIVAMEKGPDGKPVLAVDRHLELLNRDLTPNPWLSALAILLFFMWVGAAGLGAWRSTTREGRVDWKRFARHLGVSAVFLVLWLLTLRYA
ncbi:MAG: hypothetical protein GXP54_04410 [Deltaproteobacteria bacterium]|nr:hypothetical protein [Deltaproteobacteria bacterium]